MKKAIILGAAFLFFALPAPSVEFSTITSLIPSDVDRYIQTARIYRFHQLAGPFAVDHFDRATIGEIFGDIYPYFAAADIDPLSLYSITEGGIDTRRPAGFAHYNRYGKGSGYLLFIPVLNTSRAAQVFAEVRNRVAVLKNGKEAQPIQSEYRGHQIFRMGKDLFFGIINGYLVISNNSDLLKESVNLSFDNRGSFAMQEVHGFWDSNAQGDDIIRTYDKTNSDYSDTPAAESDFVRARIRLRGNELYYASVKGSREFADAVSGDSFDPALRRFLAVREGTALCPGCGDQEEITRILLEVLKPLTGSAILSIILDSSFRISSAVSRDGEKKDEPQVGVLLVPGEVFGQKEFVNLVAAMKKEFGAKGETVSYKTGQSAHFVRNGKTIFTVAQVSGKLLIHSGDNPVPMPITMGDDERPVGAMAGEGSVESMLSLFGLKGKGWEALASHAGHVVCSSGPSVLSLTLHLKKAREK